MSLLIIGILLWSLVHLSPAVAVSFKQNCLDRYGEMPYKGMFSLLILLSLALIIIGWRSSTPQYLYSLPLFTKHIAMLMISIAFLLFVTSNYRSRLKLFVRHPQMIAVVLWASAHLLLNGDSRSVVLFGGLLSWAALEIVFINKRDAQWTKPEPVSWLVEIIGVVITLVLIVGVIHGHQYLSGIPLRA